MRASSRLVRNNSNNNLSSSFTKSSNSSSFVCSIAMQSVCESTNLLKIIRNSLSKLNPSKVNSARGRRFERMKFMRSNATPSCSSSSSSSSSSSFEKNSNNNNNLVLLPHVLSAYELEFNDENIEFVGEKISTAIDFGSGGSLSGSSGRRRNDNKIMGEDSNQIWDTVRSYREKLEPVEYPFKKIANKEGGVELFARRSADGEVIRVTSINDGNDDESERINILRFPTKSNNSNSNNSDEEGELSVELMREALYTHCNAHANIRNSFDVSRGPDKSSVVLTARSSKSGDDDDDDNVLLLDQFTVNINASVDRPRLEVLLKKEQRSALTVRQILDDPLLRNSLKDGDEVVALGGPKVSGKIVLPSSTGGKNAQQKQKQEHEFGTVGEARSELNGESLLDYHRSRYKDRVSMLLNANANDDAVGLKLHGKQQAWAYPAELLSPKIFRRKNENDFAFVQDPSQYQKKVSKVRELLGDDLFSPLAKLNSKMMRLAQNANVYSPSATREGGLGVGPSRIFSNNTKAKDDKNDGRFYDLVYVCTDVDSAKNEIKQLAKEVESVLRRWGTFSDDHIETLVNDVKTMTCVREVSVVVSSPNSKNVKPIAHIVREKDDDRSNTNVNIRWAADKERERFAMFLNANRGGSSVTNQKALLKEEGENYFRTETYFVGCSIDHYYYHNHNHSNDDDDDSRASTGGQYYYSPCYTLVDSSGAVVAKDTNFNKNGGGNSSFGPITNALEFAIKNLLLLNDVDDDKKNNYEIVVHALLSNNNNIINNKFNHVQMKLLKEDYERAFASAKRFENNVSLKIVEITNQTKSQIKAFSWDSRLKKTSQPQLGFYCTDVNGPNTGLVCTGTDTSFSTPLFVFQRKVCEEEEEEEEEGGTKISSSITTSNGWLARDGLRQIISLTTCNQFGVGETKLPVTLFSSSASSANNNAGVVVLV
jgi:ElaB/YqjD/DUF883 family membrane-anchored ribosome-binding protein